MAEKVVEEAPVAPVEVAGHHKLAAVVDKGNKLEGKGNKLEGKGHKDQ